MNQEIDWEDVTILFLSNDRVQVDGRKHAGTYNYAEMGFRDKRSSKPNQGWGMLRTVGRAGGVIPNAATDSKAFVAMRETDRAIAGDIEAPLRDATDPIPLESNRGYCYRFRIRRAPSYDK